MSGSHSGCNQKWLPSLEDNSGVGLQVIRGEVRRFFDNFPYVKILQYSADVLSHRPLGIYKKQNG